MHTIINDHRASATTGRGPFGSTLSTLVLSWLLATATYAAPDVNLGGPCPNPDATIPGQVAAAVAGENFGVTGAAGNVFWAFSNIGTCTPTPLADPNTLTCAGGVTIVLPAGSPGAAVANTADVTVSGMPTIAGSQSFQVTVTSEDGLTSCTRNYDLVITEPFDVVFVLDRSGSMNRDADGVAGGLTRWQALEAGANGFTAAVAGVAGTGSNYGLSFFATTAFAPSDAALAGLVDIVGTPTLANQVQTELTGQSPSGWTAMGCGLWDGISKMANPARPRVVVLFTDGEQNRKPEVVSNGQDFTAVDAANDQCVIPAPRMVNPSFPAGPGSVKVISIGIWNPSIAYNTTLQALANQNRGNYVASATGATFGGGGGCTGDITATFSCAIQPALSGTSPQLVTTYQGTLSDTSPPALVTLSPAFEVNRKVGRLLLQLFYDRSFLRHELELLLSAVTITRDGTDVTGMFSPVITPEFDTDERSNFAMLRTDFFDVDTGSIPPEGSYVVELTKPSNIERDLGFRLLPFVDDHRLAMDWRVDPAAPRAGETLEPTVSLSWLGQPVTDATVTITIMKPGDDALDLAARNDTTVDPTSGPDDGSAGLQKFQELYNDPDFLAAMLPAEQTPTVTNNGDGSYSTSFPLDDVTGLYQVVYRVSADNADFDTLQRLAVQSVYVRYDEIDLDASGATTTVRDNAVVDINFRPVRPGGRFIGPAQGSGFTVDGTGISLTGVVDHQDGSYTLKLSGDPDAEVSIQLVGDEIYQGPASGFGEAGGFIDRLADTLGIPVWLVWILILLIVLLLIWLIRRLF